jgi:hypothetical protein
MISGHLLPTLRSATAISMLQQPKRQLSIVVLTSSDSSSTSSSSKISQLHDDDRVLLRICRLASDLPTSPKNNNNNSNDDNSETNTSPIPNQNTEHNNYDTTTKNSNTMNWVEHKVYRLEEVQVLKQRKDSIELQLGLGNDTIVRDFKFVIPTTTTTESNTDGPIAHFCSMILIMKELEQKRAMQQMEAYKALLLLQQQQQSPPPPPPQSGSKVSTTASTTDIATTTTGSNTTMIVSTTPKNKVSSKIQLLVEIVSITNLPITDLLSTDAYVVVRLGAHEIHRTSVISNNLSPIYTLFTGSLFTIINPSIEDFFRTATSGLTFTIKDYDTVGANDLIGTVQVPIQKLLNGTGERIAYPIVLTQSLTTTTDTTKNETEEDQPHPIMDQSSKNKSNQKRMVSTTKKVPTLYLRYKTATPHELDFIQEFMTRCSHGSGSGSPFKFYLSNKNSQNSICGIYASETFLSIRLQPLSNNLLHRHEKKNKEKEMMVRLLFFLFGVVGCVNVREKKNNGTHHIVCLSPCIVSVVSCEAMSRSESTYIRNRMDDQT